MKAWEKRLASEGMPVDLYQYFNDADTPGQAASAFARDRYSAADARGFDSTGEHARMATAMASQFGISETEAMEIVEGEFERVDRLARMHSH